MNVILILLCFTLAACNHESTNMNKNTLPSGWLKVKQIPYDQIYTDPPKSSDPSRTQFYGIIEPDKNFWLYSIPANTPVSDVVRYFKVGSHGADSYHYEKDVTIELVATKAIMISQILPCYVIFADTAGLKLKFLHQITDKDLDKLLELFPEDEGLQTGAESYIIEQEDGRHLFHRVKEENVFHFWWD